MISRVYGNNPYGKSKKKNKPSNKKLAKKAKDKWCKDTQTELVRKATSAEIKVKSILKNAGIRFKFQRKVQVDHHIFFPDFWLNDYNMIVEVDGGYHDTEEQKKKDSRRTKLLLKLDDVRDVVRFTNEEVEDEALVLIRIAQRACPFISF